MNKEHKDVVDALQGALADEYAQYLEMATQASIVTGDPALYYKEFFEKQAEGALRHAGILRERIFFLGGQPGTAVGQAHVYPTVKEAIQTALEDHKKLVDRYRKILTQINRKDGDVLYEAIEDILEDEQDDLEAFQRLAGKIDS